MCAGSTVAGRAGGGGRPHLGIVDVLEPTPGEGQQLYDVSTAGINYADTHLALSGDVAREGADTGRVADRPDKGVSFTADRLEDQLGAFQAEEVARLA